MNKAKDVLPVTKVGELRAGYGNGDFRGLPE